MGKILQSSRPEKFTPKQSSISSKNIKFDESQDNIIITIGSKTQTIPVNNFEKDDVIDLNNYFLKTKNYSLDNG